MSLLSSSPCPHFIGLGAQKSGTSWIDRCLREHPDVCIPKKEFHFFSRDHHWANGIDWYRQQMATCKPGKIVGEFSTSYLTSPEAPTRMAEHCPEARLIVSLREPVARTFSNYMNDVKGGRLDPNMPFRQALAEHPEYLEYSRYGDGLERYLARFPRQRILVLFHCRMRAEPLASIRAIYDFIGANADFVPESLNRKVNESRVPVLPGIDALITFGAESLRALGLDRVVRAVSHSGLVDRLRAVNTRQDVRIQFTAEDRAYVQATLRSDLDKLGGLIGPLPADWATAR